ncbi:uncharacterized protein JCM15063_004553 [Sporobolomyces koalae]|uniref:uncharacterized protein n=1 Tax=Sporobolomyces koalae TaxID=500713 RepID=UPI00317F98A6
MSTGTGPSQLAASSAQAILQLLAAAQSQSHHPHSHSHSNPVHTSQARPSPDTRGNQIASSPATTSTTRKRSKDDEVDDDRQPDEPPEEESSSTSASGDEHSGPSRSRRGNQRGDRHRHVQAQDPATLLFNDYFDFPSSDEEDDPDFLPFLNIAPPPSEAPISTPATSEHTTFTPRTLMTPDPIIPHQEPEGSRDWWARVFGNTALTGGDQDDDDEDYVGGDDDDESDEEEEEEDEPVLGLTREEFEKELALLTSENEGFYNQQLVLQQQQQQASNEPSRGQKRARTSSRDSSLITEERTTSTGSGLDQGRTGSEKRLRKKPPLSPVPENALPTPPARFNPSTQPPAPLASRPVPTPVASSPSTTAAAAAGEVSTKPKRSSRAIYTEEEAKERRKAQERERQAKNRQKTKLERESLTLRVQQLEREVAEWKQQALEAQARVRQLEQRRTSLTPRRDRDIASDSDDGGEYHEDDEAASTEESESDPDAFSPDESTPRKQGSAQLVDQGTSGSTPAPQLDLNLSNLGQDSLNQLLAIVHQAASKQGYRLDPTKMQAQ